MRRTAKCALGAVALVTAAVTAVPLWSTRSHYDQAAAARVLQADRQQTLLRGKYLATVADCAACHQAPDGTPFAGGLPIPTPFGVVYGSNITPDPEHGVGKYSSQDFYHALVDGIRRDGKRLYPAMPYTSYHAMRQEDIDAIYVYVMSLRPIRRRNRPLHLVYPFGHRWLLAYWDLLSPKVALPPSPYAHTSARPQAATRQEDQWLRGAYLANAVAQCVQCHTPRNFIGAMQLGKAYAGAQLGQAQAPSLEPRELARRGWTDRDLRRFLKTGIATQATMSSASYSMPAHSSQYMSEQDVAAIQRFLTGNALPVMPGIPRPYFLDAAARLRGRTVYMNMCAACHGVNGDGKRHIAPPMTTNTRLRLSDPGNLLRVIVEGSAEQRYPNGEVMQAMPAFGSTLSAQELADLANFMRAEWGGKPATVSASDVRQLLKTSW